MSFNDLFIAHAPDVDKHKHRSEIDTGRYHLFSVVVRNQTEAIDIAREIVDVWNIDTIHLCPGFTHSDVAEVHTALGGRVGVAVARGDGPSNKISAQERRREDYATSCYSKHGLEGTPDITDRSAAKTVSRPNLE